MLSSLNTNQNTHTSTKGPTPCGVLVPLRTTAAYENLW
jgi:hypothetical protein